MRTMKVMCTRLVLKKDLKSFQCFLTLIIELRLQSCFSLFSQARPSLRPQPCQLSSLSSPTRTSASSKTLVSHLIPQNNQTQKSKNSHQEVWTNQDYGTEEEYSNHSCHIQKKQGSYPLQEKERNFLIRF